MIIDKMEKDELTYHVPVLLKESVDEAQGIKIDDVQDVAIDINIDAYLPESYGTLSTILISSSCAVTSASCTTSCVITTSNR